MVKDALIKITSWVNENANRISKYSLNPGATDTELDTLSQVTKYLPPNLKDLYKTHNGENDNENWGNFFYGLLFLSIENILHDINLRTNASNNWPMRKVDNGIDPTSLFNVNWIAIGSDGSRSGLRVDLAPTPAGIYGQVIYVDGEEQVAFVVARSIGQLLQQFALDLRNGLYYLNPEALEDGQHFIEPNQEIDPANWQKIDKWKHLAL
ncbi:MAG: SMI1/KNR4 family protein [Ferruginibacter sp.]